jgi:hypothetical protein
MSGHRPSDLGAANKAALLDLPISQVAIRMASPPPGRPGRPPGGATSAALGAANKAALLEPPGRDLDGATVGLGRPGRASGDATSAALGAANKAALLEPPGRDPDGVRIALRVRCPPLGAHRGARASGCRSDRRQDRGCGVRCQVALRSAPRRLPCAQPTRWRRWAPDLDRDRHTLCSTDHAATNASSRTSKHHERVAPTRAGRGWFALAPNGQVGTRVGLTLSVSRTTRKRAQPARPTWSGPSAKRRVERARSGGRDGRLGYGDFVDCRGVGGCRATADRSRTRVSVAVLIPSRA